MRVNEIGEVEVTGMEISVFAIVCCAIGLIAGILLSPMPPDPEVVEINTTSGNRLILIPEGYDGMWLLDGNKVWTPADGEEQ